MLLFSTTTGIFLSLILLSFNVRKYHATIYLGIFFFLVSLYGLAVYAFLYSESVLLVSILYYNINWLSFLIGPMLYWYVRSILTDNSHLKKIDLWHFVPMVLFLVLSLPYIFTPYSYKLEIASYILADANFLRTFKAGFLYEILPVRVIYLMRPIHILLYAIWSAVLYIRYRTQKMELLVLSRQYFMIRWLPLLLTFLPLSVVSHTLSLSQAFHHEDSMILYSLNLLQILAEAGLTGLLVSPFFFPRILYGLPQMPESTKSKAAPHYENLYLLSIGQKADACMKEFQSFLEPDFNMTQLSVAIKIPAHHVAYYFREVKNQSFIDYRNEWRINHAKNLINEGRAERLTLEAIGLSSGFLSRKAFFTAFKKSTGTTPGSFAAQVTTAVLK